MSYKVDMDNRVMTVSAYQKISYSVVLPAEAAGSGRSEKELIADPNVKGKSLRPKYKTVTKKFGIPATMNAEQARARAAREVVKLQATIKHAPKPNIPGLGVRGTRTSAVVVEELKD